VLNLAPDGQAIGPTVLTALGTAETPTAESEIFEPA
jgi:hypothetical protein